MRKRRYLRIRDGEEYSVAADAIQQMLKKAPPLALKDKIRPLMLARGGYRSPIHFTRIITPTFTRDVAEIRNTDLDIPLDGTLIDIQLEIDAEFIGRFYLLLPVQNIEVTFTIGPEETPVEPPSLNKKRKITI